MAGDGDPVINAEHEAILHVLDRVVGEGPDALYFPKSVMAPSVPAWAGVPLIFAPDHPNLDAWDKDAVKELAKIKGRLVGSVQDPRIDTIGHARLMAKLAFDDPELEALLKASRLSLSTGFRADHDSEQLLGNIQPHHVLLFEEVPDQPGTHPMDKGAMILNTIKAEPTRKDRIIKAFESLKNTFIELVSSDGGLIVDESQEREVTNMADEKELVELRVQVTNLEKDAKKQTETITSKDAEVAALKTQVTNKDAELKALGEKLTAFENKEKDRKWDAVKARAPKGLIHKDKEAESRKEYEADPVGFATKILTFNAQQPPAGNEQGTEQAPPPAEGDAYEPPLETIGHWDGSKWAEKKA